MPDRSVSTDHPDPKDVAGAVVIGRNEGERLRRCLRSLHQHLDKIVYVDSGSTDDSVAFAKSIDVEVVELDTSIPFSAARARDKGARRLQELWPDLPYIQFVDGDCEVFESWLPAAVRAIRQSPEYAIVTGVRRERFRRDTVYNLLCDLEWDGPRGEIRACGGDFLVSTETFNAVNGFNPNVIAAEDDEFCVRVRQTGAKILRLDEDMTLHDAAMTTFYQWWKRAVRAGHAYAQVGDLHPDYFRPERLRTFFWGIGLPAAALGLAPFSAGWSLALLLLYPVSFIRIRHNLLRRRIAREDATPYAGFLTLSKFPEAMGMLTYFWRRLVGRKIEIIEYKSANA